MGSLVSVKICRMSLSLATKSDKKIRINYNKRLNCSYHCLGNFHSKESDLRFQLRENPWIKMERHRRQPILEAVEKKVSQIISSKLAIHQTLSSKIDLFIMITAQVI